MEVKQRLDTRIDETMLRELYTLFYGKTLEIVNFQVCLIPTSISFKSLFSGCISIVQLVIPTNNSSRILLI